MKKIDTELVSRFADENKRTVDEIRADLGAGADVPAYIKKIQKIIESLKSVPFRNNVMAACRTAFYEEKFLQKIDQNPYLLGFENGVLDLQTCTFRPGDPSDYISKTCGYDYKEYRSELDPEVGEVIQFWLKVLPNEEVRDCFLDICARLLKKGNDDQYFLILSGSGANGKTMAVDLLNATFGEYAVKFPTTLLTGKETASSSANPELIRAKNCTFADISEPDGDDKPNQGVIKRLSGGEKVYGRGLYSDGEEFRPTFLLFYICNKLPKFDPTDGGLWRRLLLFIFPSRFPANDLEVPATWEEQFRRKIFLRDKTILARIQDPKNPCLRQAMMWILVQRYRAISRRTVQVPLPNEVLSAISKYRAENDHYIQFFNDNLKQEAGARISFNDLYLSFKSWYSEFFGAKPPAKVVVRSDLITRWGEMSADGYWFGWRLKRLEDQIEDGEAAIVDNMADMEV